MTDILDQQPFHSKDELAEKVQHSAASIAKPLYDVDRLTNNNRKLYENLIDFTKDDLDSVKGSVTGSIVSIINDGLILFVPMDAVYRVYCPNEFIRDKSRIRLGDWFTCEVVAIKRKEENDFLDKLLVSHIVIEEVAPFAMNDAFSDWQQRYHGGILEILVRLPISLARISAKQSIFHIENSSLRLFQTEYGFKVLIPEKRFYSFYDPKAFELDPNTEHIFELWATLGKSTQYRDFEGNEGYCCLSVLNRTPIYEVLLNGRKVDVETWKRQSLADCETNAMNEELKLTENNEIEESGKSADPKEADPLKPRKTEIGEHVPTANREQKTTSIQEQSNLDLEVAETEKTMQRMLKKRLSQQGSLKDGTLLEEAAEKLRAYYADLEPVQERDPPSWESLLDNDTSEEQSNDTSGVEPSTSKEKVVSQDAQVNSTKNDARQEEVKVGASDDRETVEEVEQFLTPSLEPETVDREVSFEQMLESMSIMLSYTEVQEAAESQGLTGDLERIRCFISRQKK